MGAFRAVFATADGGNGIGGFDLNDPADQVFSYDFDSSGRLDHLVLYRPGGGTVRILKGGANPTSVFASTTGIGGCDLANTAYEAFAYDYNSSGRRDHIVIYRTDTGDVIVVQHDATGFSTVLQATMTLGGDASKPIRAFAYDFGSSGRLDHIVAYRPGTGVIAVLGRSDAGFNAVRASNNGIGGFDLSSDHDRGFAFDYASTGRLDHIALYRPGGGKMFILKPETGGQGFTVAYQSLGPDTGVGDHKLDSTADRILAYDHAWTGNPDHLVIYRPGAGTFWILQRDVGGGYTAIHKDTPTGQGVGGFDLGNAADRILAYDLRSTGRPDHLVLYRPGRGAISVLERLCERRDVWTLLANDPWDPVTLWYARAVQVMQARPANDPTSWSYQAAMHGISGGVPPGNLWNQCQHGGWYFLPWHRMFVYYFERIVRAAVIALGGPRDFALPYWNYAQPSPADTLPRPFRTPTLPDTTANPLFIPAPGRDASYMGGSRLSPAVTSSVKAMADPYFSNPNGNRLASFGGGQVGPRHFATGMGLLEGTPHGAIHNAIGGAQAANCTGGLMTSPNCAARDPIFWLHHANIDRLWDAWLAQGGGRANPTDGTWLNRSFDFYDENGQQVSLTCGQVLDTASQLGYVYR